MLRLEFLRSCSHAFRSAMTRSLSSRVLFIVSLGRFMQSKQTWRGLWMDSLLSSSKCCCVRDQRWWIPAGLRIEAAVMAKMS